MKYVLLILVLIISSCSKEKNNEIDYFKVCTDSGGIPIESTWDGRLANCIYPPKKSTILDGEE
jgi:hypothetical protein